MVLGFVVKGTVVISARVVPLKGLVVTQVEVPVVRGVVVAPVVRGVVVRVLIIYW